MVDLVDKEKAVRAYHGGVVVRLVRHFTAWPVLALACAIVYAVYVVTGARTAAFTSGRLSGLAVSASTAIYRDERGIPHIRASSVHDAFFAEGFAQASDRLFQMDLYRRYIYGQLAQMLGPIQLGNDEEMRALDVHDIVDREWLRLSESDRAALRAFSDGVNAAMRLQPLPIEFRLLLYAPQPWKPQDCLAMTLAISSSLGDTADNVLERDALWRSRSHQQYAQLLPLSDPLYDVALSGRRRAEHAPHARLAWSGSHHLTLTAFGSNAWAAGGAHTKTGHALLANDPHLSSSIPGVWYAVEMRAPGLHVAGVTVPGIPGVVLGHNGRIAWATTNAIAATLSVFSPDKLDEHNWKREVFNVRFAPDTVKRYYRTGREFGVVAQNAHNMVLVRWFPYADSRSALSTVFALDRAQTMDEALRALSHYAGPAQNFILADSTGRVAYHLAGPIPDDPAWGRYVHPASDLSKNFPTLPFVALPAVTASRQGVVLSANNKMYADGYPYRLSAMFGPPYRAYRIASLLHERRHYDVAYFAHMQLDDVSPVDAEFAHRLAAYARTHAGFLPPAVSNALARWNGSYSKHSRSATLEHQLRTSAEAQSISPYAVFDALRRSDPPRQLIDALRAWAADGLTAPPQWGTAGAVTVFHPFGPIGFPFLNGGTFPGAGDAYTIRVQTDSLTQSFRAVWEPGDWDRGGLSLPSGESGEISSAHYDDLRGSWIRGDLEPLPFSDGAVARTSHERLLLTP